MGIPLIENKQVWGFPYLKIDKLQEINFMLFDRYEIHIQASVHFINGKLIIFNPHLHKIILRNIYSTFTYKNLL